MRIKHLKTISVLMVLFSPNVALAHGGDMVRLSFLIIIAIHFIGLVFFLMFLSWRAILTYILITINCFLLSIFIFFEVFKNTHISMFFYVSEFFTLLFFPFLLFFIFEKHRSIREKKK
jgi:hypothetical protein